MPSAVKQGIAAGGLAQKKRVFGTAYASLSNMKDHDKLKGAAMEQTGFKMRSDLLSILLTALALALPLYLSGKL